MAATPTRPPRQALSRRAVLVLGGVAALLVGASVWLLWPNPTTPPPRERQYLEFNACLLTDQQGLHGPDAAPVWAGMQDASLATHAKVQYLTVTGAQTTDNASTFLASLAQGRCNLVFAAGESPAAAVQQNAHKFPTVVFYTIGTATDADNHIHIQATSAEEVQKRVNGIITDAVRRSGQ